MGTTKTSEKNASIEMFSPSVSPSAARDAEIKQSVEMELANFSPETSIPNPVMVDGKFDVFGPCEVVSG